VKEIPPINLWLSDIEINQASAFLYASYHSIITYSAAGKQIMVQDCFASYED
jgi:hypothetical protein